MSMREPHSSTADEVDSDDSLPKSWAKRVRQKTVVLGFVALFYFLLLSCTEIRIDTAKFQNNNSQEIAKNLMAVCSAA